jgi:hypothetical protein
MKIKLTIALLVGIIIGMFAYRTWDSHTATARHWRAVRKYSAYMRDPASYKPIGKRFTMADEPFDPMPHLAALVSEGELIHADVVVPTLLYSNRDATRCWMDFCNCHPDDIIYAEGATDDGPIHFNIWFTHAGETLFEQLLKELKEMENKKEPTKASTLKNAPHF